jgi:tagatose-1,6-bisphosphate aldolase non-catalytic subunit AgaZ/GatZ
MIELLDGRWRVYQGDNLNVIVERLVRCITKDGHEVDHWKLQGYYPDLSSALERLVERVLEIGLGEETDTTSVEALRQELARAKAEILEVARGLRLPVTEA